MSSGSVPITLVGNLTADPDLRFLESGTACVRFSVACNPRIYDQPSGQWKDGDPSYFEVTAWRYLAENVAESLHRGDRVMVHGVLSQRHWEKDGEKRSSWQVTAEAAGPDLTYATAKTTKATRTRHGEVAPDDPWATGSRTRPGSSE